MSRVFARAGFVVALVLAPVVSAQSKVDPALIASFAAAAESERVSMMQTHPEIVRAPFLYELSATGTQMRVRGELTNAVQMYEAVLFIARRANIPASESIAYNNLGIVSGLKGDLAGATAYFENAMRIADTTGDVRTVQSSWGNLGIVQRREGDLDRAEVSGQQALRLAEGIGDKAVIARALNNLGLVYDARGDGSRALETYRRSLALKEEAGVAATDLSTTLTNIGSLYDEQSDYAQALHHHQRALDLLNAAGVPPSGTMSLLNNIGHTYAAMGETARARSAYERALAAAEAAGAAPLTATVLYNLGNLARDEGKLEEAERLQRRAIAIREQSGDRKAVVESLTELAHLMTLRGRLREALPEAGRAVALADESRLLNQLWKAQTTQAMIHHRLGEDALARTGYQASIATIERLRQMTAGGDASHRQYLAERVGPYYRLAALDAAAGRAFDALAAVEQSRARALIDIVANGRQPSRHLSPAQQQRERELTQRVLKASARLEAEAGKPAPDRQRLTELEDDRERARVARDGYTAELYARQPGLSLARANVSEITPAGLGALLDKQTIVVTFVLDEVEAWVYAVAAGEAGPVVTPRKLTRTTPELQRLAEAFAQKIASRDLSFAAPARSLYADLLGPVDGILASGRSLIVVPDGPLWQVPFQALISPRGKFVVEERAISYAPSLSALGAIEDRGRKRTPGTQFLLALGDPAAATPADNVRSGAGGGLPEAAREVQALGRLYGANNSAVLTSTKASEAALRSEVARASVLHIATHGVLDDRNPMYSHLRLAGGTATAAPSLADHLTDGRLDAWELLDLDLNADLAVLSACETARGTFGWGEGLIGLSWALVASGASTAVVSQWEVDSASTTKLMIAFHDRLLKSSDGAPAALRAAATSVMKEPAYRHPFYWAGFIAVGAR